MRTLGRVVSLVLLAAWSAPATARAEAPPGTRGDSVPLASLSDPVREWSEPADFEALRAEWAARPDFAARCEQDRPLTPAVEALQAQRWSALLAIAEPWSRRCPVDMEAHELRARALAALGRLDDAEDAEMWSRGLFEAALASGDGKTAATAYRVLADFEAYSLLRAFHWAPQREEPVAGGADRFTIERRADEGDGQDVAELYFAPIEPARLLAEAVASTGAGRLR